MEGGATTNKSEAERWLEISERLLHVRDLVGSRKFAVRAQESDPNLEGVDQVLAVADVLLAAEKRINNHMDWYAILQLDHQSHEDLELMKRQFRRLVLLLHPDKNKFEFADNAFKLVSDAWTVLSDPSKKGLYDNELNLFMKFDPVNLHNPQTQTQTNPQAPQQQQGEETPVRRSTREKRKAVRATQGGGQNSHPRAETRATPVTPAGSGASKMSTFWTACPYCYNLYEYPRVYEDCCLRCQNCRRAFHATVIPSLPPVVPGEEAYYCCWAFFPLGYSVPGSVGGKSSSTPNWTPFSAMHPVPGHPGGMQNPQGPNSDKDDDDGAMDVSDGSWDSRAEPPRRGRPPNSAKKPIVEPRTTRSQATRMNKGDGNFSGQGNEDAQDGNVNRGFHGTGLPDAEKPQKVVKKRAVARKSVRQMGRANPGPEIVDLNAAAKNEDEHIPGARSGVQAGGGNEDPIAGIGFFEGLDEILGHLGGLPILNVAEEQKAAEDA